MVFIFTLHQYQSSPPPSWNISGHNYTSPPNNVHLVVFNTQHSCFLLYCCPKDQNVVVIYISDFSVFEISNLKIKNIFINLFFMKVRTVTVHENFVTQNSQWLQSAPSDSWCLSFLAYFRQSLAGCFMPSLALMTFYCFQINSTTVVPAPCQSLQRWNDVGTPKCINSPCRKCIYDH